MKSLTYSICLIALLFAPVRALSQGVETDPTGVEDLSPDNKDAPQQGPAWLGVMMEPADSGVRVATILHNSPAERAGLSEGDIILRVGEVEVDSPDEVRETVRASRTTEAIAVVIRRGDETLEKQVELETSPPVSDILRRHFVGRPAPKLVWSPVHSPDDQRSLGDVERPMVVEFWATWCSPCKPMRDHLGRLAKRVGSDVGFVALSAEDIDRIKQAGARDNAAGTAYIPIGHVAESILHTWIVEAYPTVFVIDKDGRVAGVFTGLESRGDISTLVEQLAGESDGSDALLPPE